MYATVEERPYRVRSRLFRSKRELGIGVGLFAVLAVTAGVVTLNRSNEQDVRLVPEVVAEEGDQTEEREYTKYADETKEDDGKMPIESNMDPLLNLPWPGGGDDNSMYCGMCTLFCHGGGFSAMSEEQVPEFKGEYYQAMGTEFGTANALVYCNICDYNCDDDTDDDGRPPSLAPTRKVKNDDDDDDDDRSHNKPDTKPKPAPRPSKPNDDDDDDDDDDDETGCDSNGQACDRGCLECLSGCTNCQDCIDQCEGYSSCESNCEDTCDDSVCQSACNDLYAGNDIQCTDCNYDCEDCDTGDCYDGCDSNYADCEDTCTANCDASACESQCGSDANCAAACRANCVDSQCQDTCEGDYEGCADTCEHYCDEPYGSYSLAPTPAPTTPAPTTTATTTAEPTPFPTVPRIPLNFDVWTLITSGGGGRAYQQATVYDTDWEKRPSPILSYRMRYVWRRYPNENNERLFGAPIVRDSGSPVFPSGTHPHPPILDGFGTWRVTVSPEARDSNDFLPPVPEEHRICQNNYLEVGGGEYPKNSEDDTVCTHANDEVQVYGPGQGVLYFRDFVYVWDFCATGLRGMRSYWIWFSPTTAEYSYAQCPYECDPATTRHTNYKGTITEAAWSGGAGGAQYHVCVGPDPYDPLNQIISCTNKVDDDIDGPWGELWVTADLFLDGGGWPVPTCCEYGTTTIVPTAVCDENECSGDIPDLVDCTAFHNPTFWDEFAEETKQSKLAETISPSESPTLTPSGSPTPNSTEHPAGHDDDDDDDNDGGNNEGHDHDHKHNSCHLPPPHMKCSATASMANGDGVIVFEAQAQEYEGSDEYDAAKVHCHVECSSDEDERRLTENLMTVPFVSTFSDDESAYKYGVLTAMSCCVGYCRSYTTDCQTDYVQQECCHKPKPVKQQPMPRPKPQNDDDDCDNGDCYDGCDSNYSDCEDTCTANCDASACKSQCEGNVNCEAVCQANCVDSQCQDTCEGDYEGCADACEQYCEGGSYGSYNVLGRHERAS